MVKKEIKKEWYKSKTMYAALIILVVTVANAMGVELPLEPIYAIAGAFGLYGIRDSVSKITK